MRRAASNLGLSFRYLMRTEVHVYAFSIAANVLLSFYPFMIVTMALSRAFFGAQLAGNAVGMALRDYFPDALENFLVHNLPRTGPIQLVSIFLLLFTANGVFEPLEVALNRIWGIRENRSFFRNQLVSLGLIFVCGVLALMSLAFTAFSPYSMQANISLPAPLQSFAISWAARFSALFFKFAAVSITVLVLLIVYRYLPNGRPPIERILPAAVGVGLVPEAFKYINSWVWPSFQRKIANEYGVFQYSVTLIFLSFISSLIVLAGAEWAARGHGLETHNRLAMGDGLTPMPVLQHATRLDLAADEVAEESRDSNG